MIYLLYSFQINSIAANIPKENHSKTLIKFVSAFRHHTILTKSQTTAEERQMLDGRILLAGC